MKEGRREGGGREGGGREEGREEGGREGGGREEEGETGGGGGEEAWRRGHIPLITILHYFSHSLVTRLPACRCGTIRKMSTHTKA